MNARFLNFCVLTGFIALGAIRDGEARAIRADNGNWTPNGTAASLDVLPQGLFLNPLGTTPLSDDAQLFSCTDEVYVGQSDSAVYTDVDAQSYGNYFNGVDVTAPYSNSLLLDFGPVPPTTGPNEQITFIYLGSSAAIENQNRSDLGVLQLYDASGNPIGEPVDAWQVEFNCNSSGADCSGGASLQWNGVLYIASSTLLNNGNALNQFVFNNGILYPPPGWLATAPVGTTSCLNATITTSGEMASAGSSSVASASSVGSSAGGAGGAGQMDRFTLLALTALAIVAIRRRSRALTTRRFL